MTAFRYRTAVLLGSWRPTEAMAVRDAIRAKQAMREEDGVSWRWIVPGVIEERGLKAPTAPEKPEGRGQLKQL